MPETNLPPLRIHVREDIPNKDNLVDVVVLRKQLPELPEQIRQKLKMVFNISPEVIMSIMVSLLQYTAIKKKHIKISECLTFFVLEWFYIIRTIL